MAVRPWLINWGLLHPWFGIAATPYGRVIALDLYRKELSTEIPLDAGLYGAASVIPHLPAGAGDRLPLVLRQCIGLIPGDQGDFGQVGAGVAVHVALDLLDQQLAGNDLARVGVPGPVGPSGLDQLDELAPSQV